MIQQENTHQLPQYLCRTYLHVQGCIIAMCASVPSPRPNTEQGYSCANKQQNVTRKPLLPENYFVCSDFLKNNSPHFSDMRCFSILILLLTGIKNGDWVYLHYNSDKWFPYMIYIKIPYTYVNAAQMYCGKIMKTFIHTNI